MTKYFPLKFKEISQNNFIFSNEVGDYFFGSDAILERFASNELTDEDNRFLLQEGFSFQSEDDLYFTSYLSKWTKRQAYKDKISYLILVPTLRCDLSCSYCQVSRVSENAKGFDWSEETAQQMIQFLDQQDSSEMKVEFQGGEPTLRLDLIQKVIDFCQQKFDTCEFVICTNLQNYSDELDNLLLDDSIKISTSLDATIETHTSNRTLDNKKTQSFFNNLKHLISKFGIDKVSALPTIDISKRFDPAKLYKLYSGFGFRSIYFRPINYQGFARKKHSSSKDGFDEWVLKYFGFINHLIDEQNRTQIELDEYYFTLCLKRFLQAGHDNHVDLRNPTPFGSDYLVIDYDGTFYPSDEARMLSRIGQIDLNIGHLSTGIDKEKINQLNSQSLNNFNEECIHCPYQYACGTDLVDDLSRYKTLDIPKIETWFCKQQTAIFDRISLDLREQNRTRLRVYENWLNLHENALSETAMIYDTINN